MVRSIILFGFYTFMVPLAGIIGIPWTFISGRVDFLYWLAMRIAYGGIRLVGVPVEVIGLDRFDHAGTYIYMCNHVSNLDPPIVVPLIPRRTSVLVKRELFKIPVLSRAMRLGRLVPVDRRNRDAAIESIHRAAEVLRDGLNMIVFPEGTRSTTGKLLSFKKGPFHLALESGVPIIPMTIYGTETMMPKGDWRIHSGKVTLIFHSPISPADYPEREKLMRVTRETIASALPEWQRA
jgi:1-acyl-sn-glycerol-3-phosphate acyltransferase